MLADEDMNKAERLAIARVVAPALRRATAEAHEMYGVADAKMRRVARVDADGKVVGYTTLAEVQKALLKAHAIEIETVDGARPKDVICELCGKPVKVERKSGRLPRVCRGGCERQQTCATERCESVPPKWAFKPANIKRRGGPWVCGLCTRRVAARKALSSQTSEQRSEAARKGNEARTPEQRSAAARHARRAWHSKSTPDRRKEIASKASKASASRTPERRSESARKGNATRRARSQKVPE